MSKTRIFIFAYYSYKDPVFQSAVLPYFTDFPSERFNFTVLTWEQKRFRLTARELMETQQLLQEKKIKWYRSYWHSGRFKFIKKLFDTIWGILFSIWIVKQEKIDIVYSEGFPGAIIGHLIALLTGKKHIVHTFEPHADAMIEAEVWSKTSWEAQTLKYFERKIAKRASGIITATNGMIDNIKSWKTNAFFLRAPSCVDTSKFYFNEDDRRKLRQLYNVKNDDFVITYLGKFGGMYMEEEIFDFFSYCEKNSSINMHYWLFTIDPIEKVLKLADKYQLPKEKILIKSITRDEVPKYLSASDIGFVGVRQKPSRRYCSPIKDGEYWSCGLPLLIPKGISDDYLIAEKNNIGVVLEDHTFESYDIVLKWIVKNHSNFNNIRKASRAFAIQDRSLKTYQKKFKELFERVISQHT